jgi:hypothetical protein
MRLIRSKDRNSQVGKDGLPPLALIRLNPQLAPAWWGVRLHTNLLDGARGEITTTAARL